MTFLPQVRDYSLGRISFGMIYSFYFLGFFYLVGKEVDYRLKIYFRSNSSLDRLFYRFFSGFFVSMIVVSFLSLFPAQIQKVYFWLFWVLAGFLYIWPTRAKVLKEPFLKEVSEFKYLDNFEKLLVVLCAVLAFISIPPFQEIYDVKLFWNHYDSSEIIHPFFHSILNFLYIPVQGMGSILTTSWHMFFYFMTYFTLLLGGYCFFRFFFNRRLSLLGVFSIATSWPVVIIWEHYSLLGGFVASFSLLWFWSVLWMNRSSTYRSGLFIGLLSCYGYMLFNGNLPFYLLSILLAWFLFFRGKTLWFKKQFLRYSLLGFIVLINLVIFDKRGFTGFFPFELGRFFSQWSYNFTHKDFYILSVLGLLVILFFSLNIKGFADKFHIYNRELFGKLLISFLGFTFISLIFSTQGLSYINSIWMMAFVSLVPLEWLFQATRRLRSKSNLIYGIYIVICLMDSRIEGRIKNLVKFIGL